MSLRYSKKTGHVRESSDHRILTSTHRRWSQSLEDQISARDKVIAECKKAFNKTICICLGNPCIRTKILAEIQRLKDEKGYG